MGSLNRGRIRRRPRLGGLRCFTAMSGLRDPHLGRELAHYADGPARPVGKIVELRMDSHSHERVGLLKLRQPLDSLGIDCVTAIRNCLLALLIVCNGASGQDHPRDVRPRVDLPTETVGLDAIVHTLVAAFDRVDVVALADTHQRKVDSDLRIRVIRDPDFVRKVHLIVVEFANIADQAILDRYIDGDDVPLTQLQQIWRNTCCGAVWDSPVYAEFLAAVRNVNKSLPVTRRVRVLAGDPPTGTPTTQRDRSAVSVLREHVLDNGGKALLVYGGGHLLYPNGGITKAVQTTHPGRILVVEVCGGQDPAYKQFDRVLRSSRRPILFSATSPPFDNFNAEFLGGGNRELVGGVWFDAKPRQGPPLGQLVDALVYLGTGPEVEIYVRPLR